MNMEFCTGMPLEHPIIQGLRQALFRCMRKCLPLVICTMSNAAEPVRIAVLPDGRGGTLPLAALLEAQLATNDSYVILERESISKLIKEWNLILLSAAESIGERAELGRVLKADILVMLSEHAEPSPRLDLVVSEATRGLRLRTVSFPKSPSEDDNLRVLQDEIAAAIAKQAEGLTGIFAVPPFVSMDLTGDHGHLGLAYARLLEACLQDIPGILVVEIAEARKIAEELILTGGEIEREYPMYLLGEYRFDTVNPDRPPFLRLIAKRGETEIWREDTKNAHPSTAAAFLRKSLQDHLRPAKEKHAMGSGKNSEIRILNKRARDHFAVGFFEECAQVSEASLALDPQQPELLQLAMSAYGNCCKSRKPLMEVLRYRLLALSHAEALLNLSNPSHSKVAAFVSLTNSVNAAIPKHFPSLDKASAEERKAVIDYLHRRREMLMRVIAAKHELGQLNDAVLRITLTNWLSEHHHYGESLRDNLRKRLHIAPMLIAKGVTRPESHLRDLTMFGLSDAMKSSGDFTWFLDELSRIKHPAVTRVVASGRKIAADLKSEKKMAPGKKPSNETSGDSAACGKILFEPLRFSIPGNKPLWLHGLLACGNGTDILWGWSPESSVFLMKEKGVLQPLHKIAANHEIGQVCFDGRYIWMPVEGARSEILAIDSLSGSVVAFTPDDGFPNFHFSACAPIGEGRLCFSGSFGVRSEHRAYIAVLELSAGGKKKVRIIHEATRQKLPGESEREAEMDASLSFVPGFMLSTPRENGGPGEVMLKRMYHNSCLSIQPDAGKVEAFPIEQNSFLPRQVTFQQNRAFWAAGRYLKSLRAGSRNVENLREIPASQHGTDTRVIRHENRTHFAGDQWWLAEGEDGRFRKLTGEIPGNRHHHRSLYLSSHYGIVFTTSTEKDKAYQVVITSPETDSP